MRKALRALTGLTVVGLLLFAASVAVRDCSVGPSVYVNCFWLWLRGELGLPQSKLLRAGALWIVGLALLVGVIVVLRAVFPRGFRASGREERADHPPPPESARGPGRDL